ncbi:cytochrome c oxidase subunit 2A [Aquibacillus kalidii]|nr:cytochrome c oxidase subunit 2A [Aquibacillus kalidii]
MSKNSSKKKQEEHDLKGTLISVLGIGAFIVISWFIVFALFVAR